MNSSDYESDILLINEEDDDEFGMFDYSETLKIPKILTEEDIKKMKASQKKE